MEIMNEIIEKTIGEIVAENYKAAEVFHHYGVDFCCKGNRVLKDVCKQNDISIDEMVLAIQNIIQNGGGQAVDYYSWPLDLLVDVIEKKHHAYVEEKIPVITQFLQRLCDVHGARHPELFEIKDLFTASAGELTTHMKKEELILFPFIRKLEKSKSVGQAVASPQFVSVQNPVDMMMAEHEAEGDRFRKINGLTDAYQPPSDACNTFKITYAMLQDFESDLHLHIHLENNILFPRSIALERTLAEMLK
ncbi:Nitric oxide-dependent regulator DnrN or NorA [Fulvivirga imtechensis AK7]|uniref:Nitric oxide-dependent regulator DnrN or NorA n=2 Tax=Fulvivirga TaxID=396811 RepID=L8JPV7_9BACT|nr:Nitric oxide-dependent regulator DnrN or NorA [Fulvivirga imtechensis AK7]